MIAGLCCFQEGRRSRCMCTASSFTAARARSTSAADRFHRRRRSLCIPPTFYSNRNGQEVLRQLQLADLRQPRLVPIQPVLSKISVVAPLVAGPDGMGSRVVGGCTSVKGINDSGLPPFPWSPMYKAPVYLRVFTPVLVLYQYTARHNT